MKGCWSGKEAELILELVCFHQEALCFECLQGKSEVPFEQRA